VDSSRMARPVLHCSTAYGGRSYLNGGAGGAEIPATARQLWRDMAAVARELGGPEREADTPAAIGGKLSRYSTYGGGGGSYNIGTNQEQYGGARTGNGLVTISYSIPTPSASRTPVTVTFPGFRTHAGNRYNNHVSCGGSSNLNGTSTGNNINWYTVATGGTALGTTASGANFAVMPSVQLLIMRKPFPLYRVLKHSAILDRRRPSRSWRCNLHYGRCLWSHRD